MTLDLPDRPQKENDNTQEAKPGESDLRQIIRTLEASEPSLRDKGFSMEFHTENVESHTPEKPAMLQIIVKDEKNVKSQSPFFMRNPTLRLEFDQAGNQLSLFAKPYYGIGSVPARSIANYFNQPDKERMEAVKLLVEEFLSSTIRNSVPA